MSKNSSFNYFKILIIALGSLCLLFALINAGQNILRWEFGTLLIISAFLAPRIMLTLSYSRITVEFSDAFTFFTFLLLGGEAAIILASIQTLAGCFYLKNKGFKFTLTGILSNIATSALATTSAYAIRIRIHKFCRSRLSIKRLTKPYLQFYVF